MTNVERVDLRTLDDFDFSQEIASESSDEWRKNDRGIASYSDYLFDDFFTLPQLIESQIGYDDRNVGLDLAGGKNGIALQELLDERLLGRGLVTNLHDHRSREAKQRADLDHIEGNLRDKTTWQRVVDWQAVYAPEGFSLVLHRPWGAMQDLPARFYEASLHIVTSLLKPNGLAALQIPSALLFAEAAVVSGLHASLATREDVANVECAQTTSTGGYCVVTKSR